MNKDIIRMAKEAGMSGMLTDVVCTHAELERFAELVAAHTLSKIDPRSFMSWQEGYEAGKLAEREACAKLFDDRDNGIGFYEPHEPAEMIRARSAR